MRCAMSAALLQSVLKSDMGRKKLRRPAASGSCAKPQCGDKHKSAPVEEEIEEVLRQFDDSESAPENQNDEVSLCPLSEDALAAEADNVLEESVAPAVLRPGKPRQAASSRRRQGKKVDRMEKAAARELSQQLLKRLGKEQKSKSCRSKKSKAKGCPTSNASGSLEQIMACLRADPSSARVAGHRLHKTLHPRERSKKKQSAAVVAKSRPTPAVKSPRSPARMHLERVLF